MRLPAAWIRGSQTPPCAEGWTRILAGWWGIARSNGVFQSRGSGDVWIGWLLPPRAWEDTAPRVLEDCQAAGVKGLVLNPERVWLGASADEAAALVHYFTSRGVRVWVASYGTPPSTFPMEGFAREAEGGITLTFDRENAFSRNYLSRSLAQWRARGFARVVPSVGLWANPPGPDTGRPKTPEELLRHLAQRPRGSVVWGAPTWSARTCALLTRWQSTGPAGSGAGAGMLIALLVGGGLAWAATR